MTTVYPEHDRMRAVMGESQAIGEFIEWLSSQGIRLCTVDAETYTQVMFIPLQDTSPTALLARYFDIDLAKIEQEKRAMLSSLALDGDLAREVTP